MENVKVDNVEARRSFLKKVAYVAPAVVVLGSLTLPSSAQASVFTHTTISSTTLAPASMETINTSNGTNIVTSGSTQELPTGPAADSSTYTGTQIKAKANASLPKWSWVNDLFGSSNWFGV